MLCDLQCFHQNSIKKVFFFSPVMHHIIYGLFLSFSELKIMFIFVCDSNLFFNKQIIWVVGHAINKYTYYFGFVEKWECWSKRIIYLACCCCVSTTEKRHGRGSDKKQSREAKKKRNNKMECLLPFAEEAAAAVAALCHHRRSDESDGSWFCLFYTALISFQFVFNEVESQVLLLWSFWLSILLCKLRHPDEN